MDAPGKLLQYGNQLRKPIPSCLTDQGAGLGTEDWPGRGESHCQDHKVPGTSPAQQHSLGTFRGGDRKEAQHHVMGDVWTAGQTLNTRHQEHQELN